MYKKLLITIYALYNALAIDVSEDKRIFSPGCAGFVLKKSLTTLMLGQMYENK